jgi:hypothetical protein
MEIPLADFHREIFAVPTLEDIYAKFTEVVLVWPFALVFRFFHAFVKSFCRMCK